MISSANASWCIRTDGLKKTDLEVALDDHLAENQHHSSNPKAAPYYQSRSRAIGSPVKKEAPPTESRRRRAAKAAEEALAAPAPPEYVDPLERVAL